MVRTLVALVAVVLLVAGTGCVTGRGLLQNRSACHSCGGGGCMSCGGGMASSCLSCGGSGGGCTSCRSIWDGFDGCKPDCGCGARYSLLGCGLFGHLGSHHCDPGTVSGPPAAQIAYPYYTVRGPRDFLLDNPPLLGP